MAESESAGRAFRIDLESYITPDSLNCIEMGGTAMPSSSPMYAGLIRGRPVALEISVRPRPRRLGSRRSRSHQ